MGSTSLRAGLAQAIAPVVLANVTTRQPFHDSHLFREGDKAHDPSIAHPAFANSYDWHSSVHSHWTALRLIEYRASAPTATQTIDKLYVAVSQNLTGPNVEAEIAYLKSRPNYERPYGWAWAMRLAADLDGVDPAARDSLHRLARFVGERAIEWLRVMPGPVRHGVHSNTAFALGLMLDASRPLGLDALARAIEASSRAWFGDDRDYPAAWERSANDFLSPGLTEADLMRGVLDRDAFAKWWRGFIRDEPALAAIAGIAEVPRVSDGQIVHLHGLNLSRAGALARIAAAVGGAEADILLTYARDLYEASAGEASGTEYLSTHWLPTFAWDAATSIDSAQSA